MAAKKELTYQSAIQELESILSQLESNQVDVDKMSTMVNRATELIQFCKQRLIKSKAEIEKALKLLEEEKNSE